MHLSPTLTSLVILISLPLNAAETKSMNDLLPKNVSTVCNIIGSNGEPGCSDGVKISVGNPINVLTGNKFQHDTDIQSVGDDYTLGLNRYYNSKSSQKGTFGIGWRHDYDIQLQDMDEQIDVIQADGRQMHFLKTTTPMDDSNLFITRYIGTTPKLGYLERTQSSDYGKTAWIWYMPEGRQFHFVAHKQVSAVNKLGLQRFGQLSRVTERANESNSPYWALTYGVDGKLAQVRNHLGDTLKFAYETTKSNLAKISITSSNQYKASTGTTDSTGKWVYFLDQNNNLAQVVSPTGVRTGYQYQDPFDKHNLTSKLSYDKNSKAQLITAWQYDAYDRAISSSPSDNVERVSVAYDDDTVLPTKAGHIFTNILTNSAGESTDYRYQFSNGEAKLISMIGAGCTTCGPSNISYEYDSAGRVIKMNQLDSQGLIVSSTATEFNALGQAIKITQTNSVNEQIAWRSYNYDDKNHPMKPTIIRQPSIVDGKALQINIRYDEAGNVIAITEKGHKPSILDTSVNAGLTTSTVIERTTTFDYSLIKGRYVVTAVGAPQAKADTSDNNAAKTVYNWDELGEHITEVRHPTGLTERFAYQTIAGQSLPSEYTDTKGVTTKLEYNSEGQAIGMQRGDQQLSLEYDSKQRPIKWQNQLKQTVSATYDDSKQQVTYQTHDGQQVVSQYDTEGRRTHRQWLDQQGNILIDPTMMQYNDQAAIVNKDNAGNADANIKNAASLMQLEQPLSDPSNNSVATGSNTLLASQNKDMQTDSTDAFSPVDNLLNAEADATIAIETNPLGKIKQVTLPEGATYERLYDDFGRMVYAKDANTGASIVEYDLNDQPTLIQSATTKQMASYDSAGRLTTAKYCKLGNHATAEQSCESIEYKYDGAHLSQINDPTQITQYTYDAQSRLTIESVQFKDSDKQWQTQYQYDDTGRLQKVSLPEGAALIYGYDDISNPITVKYQAPTQGWIEGLIRRINPNYNSTALISDIQGDSARGLLGFTHSNGQMAKASYDKAGRMTTWQDGDYQRDLSYDRNNQITAISSKQSSDQKSENLDYNDYGELISVTDAKQNISTQYQYDRNGNRLADISSTVKDKYEYETGTDRLLSISQTANNNDTSDNEQHSTYSYDAAGNPILISTQKQGNQSEQHRELVYGARGQLTQVSDDGKQTTEYRYNHAMQRVSKTTDIDSESKQEQRYLWQQGLLDAEIDFNAGQESLSRRYIYMGLRPVAVIDYDKDNNPSIYTIHTDHLGTPQQVTNDQQEIVWQGEYDAFGNVTVKATPQNKTQDVQAKGWSMNLMNKANAAETTASKPFELNLRFAGQYEDSESGYYYNWHRYYNPETGRYLTSDPIGLNGGLNTYGYAGQNPVQAVDPWGLFAIATWDDTINSNNRTTVYIDIPILFIGTSADFAKEHYIPMWIEGIERVYNGNFGDFDIVTKVTLLDSCEDANDPVKLPLIVKRKMNSGFIQDDDNVNIIDVSKKSIRKVSDIAIDRNSSIDSSQYMTIPTYNTMRVFASCEDEQRANPDIAIICNAHVVPNILSNEGALVVGSSTGSTAAHEAGHLLGIGFDPYVTDAKIPWNNGRNKRWHNVMGNGELYNDADWLMFSVIFDSSALVWKDGKKPKFEAYDERVDLDEYHRWRNDGNRINNSNEDKITKEMISENARKRIEKLKDIRE